MFLKSKLKSKDPEIRKKALRKMVVHARQQASRGKGEWASDPVLAADVPLVEFARTEKDADVLAYAFSQMESMSLVLSIAHDEGEDAFLRAAAIRAYTKRLQSYAQLHLTHGDNESVQQVLDVLAKECASILETCSSEEVRAAALEGMAKPEPENLQILLAEPINVENLFWHLFSERDPERVQAIVAKLKSKEAPKDFSNAKGPFTVLMNNRDSYPDYLVEGFVAVYASWTKMQPKSVRLKFANRADLDRLISDLNSSNVHQSIQALDDLQEMYRLGTFRSEIAALTYNGQSVATYRDPNAGYIITAPTH